MIDKTKLPLGITKPCPFCESSDLKVYYGIGTWVKCLKCGATGSKFGGDCVSDNTDRLNAIERWNNRK